LEAVDGKGEGTGREITCCRNYFSLEERELGGAMERGLTIRESAKKGTACKRITARSCLSVPAYSVVNINVGIMYAVEGNEGGIGGERREKEAHRCLKKDQFACNRLGVENN